MKTELVLLEIAQKDLEAAKSLFKDKLYSQAIFYLQQTVEKATKSMGIHLKIIGEDELEDIGHESVKIYVRIIEGFKNVVKKFQEPIKKIPKLKHTTLLKKYENVDPDKFSSIVDNFESYLTHPNMDISDEELEKIISELTKLEAEIRNQKITIEREEESLKLFIREVNATREEHPVFPGVYKKLKKLESLTPELMAKFIECWISTIICYLDLLYLSVILCPHAVFSRYPYPKCEHNPLEIYTEEHPLVKRFEQLSNITERVLDRLSKSFSENISERLETMIGSNGV